MDSPKEQKILEGARLAFLHHGFKRVTMQEIADSAGISRPALYLVYRSKEEVFSEVVRKNMAATCQTISRELAIVDGVGAKVHKAFFLWAVNSFEQIQASPEARELVDSGHDFAREAFTNGYRLFESVLADQIPAGQELSPTETAHLLSSAVRGFKQVATDARDLERMINNLLLLCGL